MGILHHFQKRLGLSYFSLSLASSAGKYNYIWVEKFKTFFGGSEHDQITTATAYSFAILLTYFNKSFFNEFLRISYLRLDIVKESQTVLIINTKNTFQEFSIITLLALPYLSLTKIFLTSTEFIDWTHQAEAVFLSYHPHLKQLKTLPCL